MIYIYSDLITSLLRLVRGGVPWDNLTLEHYQTLLRTGSRGFRALPELLALLAATLGTLIGVPTSLTGKHWQQWPPFLFRVNLTRVVPVWRWRWVWWLWSPAELAGDQ